MDANQRSTINKPPKDTPCYESQVPITPGFDQQFYYSTTQTYFNQHHLEQQTNANNDENEVSKTCCKVKNRTIWTCFNGISNTFSSCFFGLYSLFANLFAGIRRCFSSIHIKNEYENCFIISLIVFICMTCIFCGVFLGILKKDMDYVDTNVETTCKYYNNVVIDYICCEKNNCQCSEANYGAPSCSTILVNLIPSTTCGDGHYCCKTQCQTCLKTTDVPYDCRCDNKGKCSTCYMQKIDTYSCKCDTCTQAVNNRLCSAKCGKCYNIQTVYGYNITTEFVTQTITQKCVRDDIACKNEWLTQHPINTVTKCWYDTKYPNDGAFFEKPQHQYKKAGLPVTILFGIFSITALFLMIGLLRCSCKKE